jgi:copper homeostasis protein
MPRMMIRRPSLEVCVDSVAGLDIAARHGAERIELCSALAVGGLTPPYGLMAVAAERAIPCFVLIRPRVGDFCYDSRDIDVMRRDIDTVRALRLAGVVIGASLTDGRLDEAALRQLLQHAAGLPAVLHRAFDLVPDFGAALETAIRLGFKRVLTSGGEVSAEQGSGRIREIVTQARERIEIMAGSGLSAQNVANFVTQTRVPAVHSSCSCVVRAEDEVAARAVVLGFTPEPHKVTEAGEVAAMVAALRTLA